MSLTLFPVYLISMLMIMYLYLIVSFVLHYLWLLEHHFIIMQMLTSDAQCGCLIGVINVMEKTEHLIFSPNLHPYLLYLISWAFQLFGPKFSPLFIQFTCKTSSFFNFKMHLIWPHLTITISTPLILSTKVFHLTLIILYFISYFSLLLTAKLFSVQLLEK